MNQMLRAMCFIAGVLGGLFLCICPITAKRAEVPRLILKVVALMGAFVTTWGGLGLVALYCSEYLSGRVLDIMRHYRAICAGVAIGLFMSWCLSGHIVPFFKRRSGALKEA